MVGEVDVHIDGGVYVLNAVGPVEDNDGVLDPLYPDLLDIDVALVSKVLDVYHL
jgi:hypothetical protein